jgi:hypothetical protein
MKRFFAPNLGGKGRLVRGVVGLVLLVGAVFSLIQCVWLAALLGAALTIQAAKWPSRLRDLQAQEAL